MPLSKEAVKALLAQPKRKRGGGKKGPDHNIRIIEVWFALAPKTREQAEAGTIDFKCDNPNCVDPRPGTVSPLTGEVIKHQFVVEINGQKVCRYCFLDGWLKENPDQTSLTDGD